MKLCSLQLFYIQKPSLILSNLKFKLRKRPRIEKLQKMKVVHVRKL
jgi:hypothetical protein